MCLSAYRLESWTSYRCETGIIRITMAWKEGIEAKFSGKVISGQTTELKVWVAYAFLWHKLSPICFRVETQAYHKLRVA
jgi:hypothetical protein